MEHIKAVINQCGVAMELHDHTRADGHNNPITVALIRPAQCNPKPTGRRWQRETLKINKHETVNF